jgi:hypothetical protein
MDQRKRSTQKKTVEKKVEDLKRLETGGVPLWAEWLEWRLANLEMDNKNLATELGLGKNGDEVISRWKKGERLSTLYPLAEELAKVLSEKKDPAGKGKPLSEKEQNELEKWTRTLPARMVPNLPHPELNGGFDQELVLPLMHRAFYCARVPIPFSLLESISEGKLTRLQLEEVLHDLRKRIKGLSEERIYKAPRRYRLRARLVCAWDPSSDQKGDQAMVDEVLMKEVSEAIRRKDLQAGKYYEEHLLYAIVRAELSQDRRKRFRLYSLLGRLFDQQDAYPDAVDCYDKALERQHELPENEQDWDRRKSVGATLHELGRVLFKWSELSRRGGAPADAKALRSKAIYYLEWSRTFEEDQATHKILAYTYCAHDDLYNASMYAQKLNDREKEEIGDYFAEVCPEALGDLITRPNSTGNMIG